MKRLFPALLVGLVLCPMAGEATPRKPLHVGDIAGLYTTSDSRSPYKNLRLRLLRTYKHEAFEQGDFSGTISSQPLVGQGIISGDEGGLDDFVTFDILFINPQDFTSTLHGKSIMRNGRVVGVTLGEETMDGQKHDTFVFRRVGAK